MAQLTQMQLAEKYGVKAPDVSVAIKNYALDPVGVIRGPKREQKVYDEAAAKQAMIELYIGRANKYYEKYQEWTEKAAEIRKVDSDA